MYFVMLMHSAVNVHVNTGANENPIKAVREGSIILCFKRARFERATSTSQRRVPKVIEKLSACFQRSQSKNKYYCERVLIVKGYNDKCRNKSRSSSC